MLFFYFYSLQIVKFTGRSGKETGEHTSKPACEKGADTHASESKWPKTQGQGQRTANEPGRCEKSAAKITATEITGWL